MLTSLGTSVRFANNGSDMTAKKQGAVRTPTPCFCSEAFYLGNKPSFVCIHLTKHAKPSQKGRQQAAGAPDPPRESGGFVVCHFVRSVNCN